MLNKKESLKEVLDFLKLLIILILLPMFSIVIINFEKGWDFVNLANAALGVLAIPLVVAFIIYILCLKKFDETT